MIFSIAKQLKLSNCLMFVHTLAFSDFTLRRIKLRAQRERRRTLKTPDMILILDFHLNLLLNIFEGLRSRHAMSQKRFYCH